MKEHPVLFSTEMVKAILKGRKTQTRRVIKPQPYFDNGLYDQGWIWEGLHHNDETDLKKLIVMSGKCPYGQVGDRLWVREAFCNLCPDEQGFCYKADREHNPASDLCAAEWKPSIFMPRWASRTTLEITGIRVERLQEITHEDAIAEGAEFMPAAKLRKERLTVPQIVFAGLWDSINGKKYPWASNPWVWCIEFKRLSL